MHVFNSPPFYHFCGILLVFTLITLNHRTRGCGIFVISVWNFVGVLLHEICHLLVGMALFAGPSGFSLIPKSDGNGKWVMGSVRFRKLNALNSLPIGLAPLLLVAIAFKVYQNWGEWFATSFGSILCLYLVLFLLLYESLPSGQDLKVAFNWKSIFLYAVFGLVISSFLEGGFLHRLIALGFF
jgi:hypothetical protein